MPSGHGGGHGGGRHGGGRHGGGHSSGMRSGRASANGSGHFVGPVRFRFGHSYYVIANESITTIGVLFFAFFFLFVIMFGFCALSTSSKQNLKAIEQDREYYLDMIEKTSINHFVDDEAKVTGVYYNDSFKRWYITYSFETKSGHYIENGYSFCVYANKSDAPSYYNGLTGEDANYISVAYDSDSSQADSIPMDYVNFILTDDGEYLKSKQMIPISGVLIGLSVAGLFAIVFAIVVKIKKCKEQENEKKELAKKERLKQEEQNKPNYCGYCGTQIEKDAKKCPNCGSSMLEK